jgi:hypothetical protein
MRELTSESVIARELAITVWVGGDECESCSEVAVAGPCVLVFSTALEPHGIQLRSVYCGFPNTETHISHIVTATGIVESVHRTLPAAEAPVITARRLCLWDHLTQLQNIGEELGLGSIAADLPERTVQTLEAY